MTTSAIVRVGVVLGTRPEAIKLAPVIRELGRRPGMESLVISTGQHRTMLEQALAAFDLQPDADLRVMTPGQTLHDVTSRTLHGLRELLAEQPLDWLVVQGDTTTAFAAALAAFYARIPVAHVEAGLRSGQRYSPFPEEINRRMVDQLSQLLFAPTEASRQLLLREGFAPRQVEVTGNTVVDALLMGQQAVRARQIAVPELPPGALAGRRMLLVTAHRRESFGSGLAAIFRALRRLADDVPDVCVVYPVHLNPEVDGPARQLLGNHPRIHLIRPLAYLEFVAAMESAHLVLTDSGGVQEEVPTLRKPLLVMREVTERPEGIAAGVACLAGTSEERIYGETRRLLDDQAAYRRMASGLNPYGDGQAARRIVDRLAAESVLETRLASCERAPWSRVAVLGMTLLAGCATGGATTPRACPAGLDGTFVQLGQAQLGLSEGGWRQEVALLADTGVRMVVVQFTGDQHGAFDRRHPQRPVRTLARAAAAAGMDVWLGLHADPRWPHRFDLDHALPPPLDDPNQARALAALCRELPRCRGFYLSPELDDAGGEAAVPRMTAFLARTTAALRALAPDHRIAMAPFWTGALSPEQHARLWRPLLPLVDVFMLQDRVGSGVGSPELARRYLEALRPLLPPATQLWSVVELFDQQAGPPRDQAAFQARPARFGLIARSLSHEGAAADRLIAFSILDYMDPRRGGDAARLHADYRAWCDVTGPSTNGRNP